MLLLKMIGFNFTTSDSDVSESFYKKVYFKLRNLITKENNLYHKLKVMELMMG